MCLMKKLCILSADRSTLVNKRSSLSCMSHFVCVCHEVGKGQHGKKNKGSTWSTCCELLSELVSLLQLVKPPLIYVLRGHDIHL